MRRFEVHTTADDSELLDLFSFHVAREQVRISVAGMPSAAPVAAPVVKPEADFGFFEPLPDAEPEPVSAPQGSASTQALAAVAALLAPLAAAAAPSTSPVAQAPGAARPAAGGSGALESATIRVPIEKVDQLINLVGELVITQAMLAQTGRDLDGVIHQRMATGLTDLERNTRLLQEAVMAIRMIPMTAVFNRFPRMLRDLAGKLDKRIELHTIGEDTELDKGLIEKITDPLTHLVRNAADHGIELPADRLAAGKSEHGTVTLAAAHEGGSIVIEVRDDGRGLNRGKLLRKAAERGLAVSVLADARQHAETPSSLLSSLAAKGIPVWLETRYRNAHNKIMVIDDGTQEVVVVTGSYNFTRSAQRMNSENLFLIRGNLALARRFRQNWERHRADAVALESARSR
jgi:two-component system chemotaxis sensor kinase CheA